MHHHRGASGFVGIALTFFLGIGSLATAGQYQNPVASVILGVVAILIGCGALWFKFRKS